MHLPQKLNTPARISICAFVGLILVGTTLLMLPEASTQRPLSFVDALFAAISACCLAGLIVVDTSKDLTRCGQLVVLGLIQARALGIFTLSTVFLLLAGRMAGRFIVQGT